MENATVVGNKLIFAAMGAWITAMLNGLAPLLIALAVVMVVDYITGMTAAWKEGTLSSKVGLLGIGKKALYAVGVVLGMVIDWVIISVGSQIGISMPTTTFFGLLVTLWLIFNECVSIIENLGRVGVPYPEFMIKAIAALKGKVEKSADKAITENIESEDK